MTLVETIDADCGRCGNAMCVHPQPDFASAYHGYTALCRWCELEVVPSKWPDEPSPSVEAENGTSETLQKLISSETDEWSTPLSFVRPLARALGGFDLDPASGAETSPIAQTTYTEDEDGLSKPWFGRVWLNPPYSEMAAWMEKCMAESKQDNTDVILALVKGDTSTDWWHRYAPEADAVAFLDHRLKFGEDAGSAPFPNHVFVFGDAPSGVYDVLEKNGLVVRGADWMWTDVQSDFGEWQDS